MTKLAIDAVLLPSPAMTAKAIAINQELLKTGEPKIVLDAQNCLPHISLCMGVIDSTAVLKVNTILQDISREFTALDLTAECLRADIIPTGKKVSGLRITNTPSLQQLRQTIMDRLWPFLSYKVDAAMLYNPPEVEEVTFGWIRAYARHHNDPTAFHPHMTVGFGETEAFVAEFPMHFSASTLVLCQLGNYCTCRRVLGRFELKG